MINNLSIQIVTYEENLSSIQSIRKKVFQEEQKISPELEFDGKDSNCKHLLAFLKNKPVGTTRIRFITNKTAKIERLAVLSSVRGKGIGSQLMQTALQLIQNQYQFDDIIIHAQLSVAEWYKKFGFQAIVIPDKGGVKVSDYNN